MRISHQFELLFLLCEVLSLMNFRYFLQKVWYFVQDLFCKYNATMKFRVVAGIFTFLPCKTTYKIAGNLCKNVAVVENT